jgi:hypothetical protein
VILFLAQQVAHDRLTFTTTMAASVPCKPLRRRPSVTFCIQVSPPTDLAQQVANFLEQKVPTVLKRKASLELTSDLAKKAFVDPAASMNETVRDYVARANAVLPSEREKISVHIPEVWPDIPSFVVVTCRQGRQSKAATDAGSSRNTTTTFCEVVKFRGNHVLT